VELAGLEPATSWVRFGRNPSPPFAMLRHLRQPGRSRRRAFATGCHLSSRLLDQNLTSARRRGLGNRCLSTELRGLARTIARRSAVSGRGGGLCPPPLAKARRQREGGGTRAPQGASPVFERVYARIVACSTGAPHGAKCCPCWPYRSGFNAEPLLCPPSSTS
jgi:hypothetical protein